MPKPFCPDWATALLNGFSQVLLQRHPLCGLCCLLAILLCAPQSLGGALLGAATGLLTAQRRGYPREHRQAGLFSYNGVLIGLLFSHWLPLNLTLPLLIIAASGLSSLLVARWLAVCARPTCLPAYTAPFVLAGWALAWAVVPGRDTAQVFAVSDLLTGLGQVFVLASPMAGALVLLGLWLADRRAACWALAASAAGLGFAWLQNEPPLPGLYGVNPALAAVAFSTRPRYAVVAVVLTLLLQPGFASLPVPALTAPFVLACWLVKASARLLQGEPALHRPR
ncbi:urea transporter [Pseudomonas eucalypticola]|uniref:Urea transporter n=1 Tax=Pseudomonas eucalypticola TaxID=2599595 RepID=A0A7D5HYX0_9PSED|nr:urea transporter [Pseudomonas eucalypticola]QKZ06011.1 urea transporter [Pseudomonas eucalypticola]